MLAPAGHPRGDVLRRGLAARARVRRVPRARAAGRRARRGARGAASRRRSRSRSRSAALAFGWLVYQKGGDRPGPHRGLLAAALRAVARTSSTSTSSTRAAIVRPLLALARGALRFDLGVIDGIVNGVAETARGWGAALARLQTGRRARLPALHGARPGRRPRRPAVAIRGESVNGSPFPILSVLVFGPVAGALALALVPGGAACGCVRGLALAVTLGGLRCSPSGSGRASRRAAGFQFVERLRLDPRARRRVPPRRRRAEPAARAADRAARPGGRALLDGARPGAREGLLRHAAVPPGRPDRRLRRPRPRALLHLLGGDADPDVPAHRHLGRAAPDLRLGEVLPLHARRQPADARRDDRRLPAPRRAHRRSTPSTWCALTQLSYPPQLQVWAFLGFFVAFAIKVPLVPFHTWLPDAHVEAPTAGSVVLAGVLLKMGTYGLMRFSLPLFPDASRYFAPDVLTLAVVGIIYGAVLALAQDDLKKLIAYSSISHLGLRRRRDLLLRPARRGRRGAPDDRPRADHRRALPLRRHGLRAHAPALDPAARRAGAPAPGLRDAAGVLLAGLARAARAGRVRRRVPDPGRRLRRAPRPSRSAPPSASCSAPPTCSGCSSA